MPTDQVRGLKARGPSPATGASGKASSRATARSQPRAVGKIVVPAKAGTHLSTARAPEEWIPAFAGTTRCRSLRVLRVLLRVKAFSFSSCSPCLRGEFPQPPRGLSVTSLPHGLIKTKRLNAEDAQRCAKAHRPHCRHRVPPRILRVLRVKALSLSLLTPHRLTGDMK
jgi:hypothetical protein